MDVLLTYTNMTDPSVMQGKAFISTKTYAVCTQKNSLNETVLLSTQNILYVKTDG